MSDYHDDSLTPQERAEALADTLTVQQQAEQLKYDAPAIPSAGLQLVERGAARSCTGRYGDDVPAGDRTCRDVRPGHASQMRGDNLHRGSRKVQRGEPSRRP